MMEPNESSGLTSYFQQHHQQQPQQPAPSSTLSPPPTSAAATLSPPTNGGLSSAAAAPPPVEPQRRKRGRPRKYATPEAAIAAKRAAVPASVRRREQQHLFSSGGGSSNKKSNSIAVGGQGFTPHIINVAAGEDVGQKIMLFMQQTRRELCVLSASGSISNVSLRQPSTSGGNVTYQGCFEIISLAGSYVRSDLGGKAGGLSACLISSQGEIVGGGVGGPLIAAGPVEVIVATFLIDQKKDASGGFKADVSVSKMTSPVSASTAVYRPVVEPSGGFNVTGNDDHHNIDGNSFMMQPQWRGGIDYDIAGNTGHHDSHDSRENGDYEQMPD